MIVSRHGAISAFVLVALAATAAAGSRTIHVAPDPLPGLDGAAQARTISEAAQRVQPGDTVVIHFGVYRETVIVQASGTADRPIRFEAAQGETVVITGADELRDWRKEAGDGGVFSTAWPHRFNAWTKSGAHPDDAFHQTIGRCEQVFLQGYPLLQVLDRDRVAPGTFHVDLAEKRLYVCPANGADLAAGKGRVEASVRQVLWHSKGAHVHLRGLRFRYAANMAQRGAAIFEGAHGLIEDCVFERTNSSGAAFWAPNLVVRRCTFQDNGQLGFSAKNAHGLLMSQCLVRNNNTKGFNRQWEAGGNKIVLSRGVVLERCRFVDNRGVGVWFDIGNERCTVRNCFIAGNEDAGIFYEISYGLHAHDNVIVGNGLADTPGMWGAAAGISLSSSQGCLVERNLLIGNREGLSLREQPRTTPLIDDRKERPIWTANQTIRNNVMADNRDAQVWGWFDVADGRHWPAAMQSPEEKQGDAGEPAGLSLEKLKVAFEGNVYAAQPGRGLFNWGVAWKRHAKYADLERLRRELAIDTGSVAEPFVYGDYPACDFRVPADSPAVKLGCYPRGEVPGALLGTLPAK